MLPTSWELAERERRESGERERERENIHKTLMYYIFVPFLFYY
jgi:hypothetical protein